MLRYSNLANREVKSEDFFMDKWELYEAMSISNLRDIRQNPSYKDFVRFIGGIPLSNFIENNGYDILAKDYKREIKYSAGNLMQI